ncbi:alanine racemase [Alteromonas sp. ASW11-19]|uniref:Alanine racemase n=1 Tax=Alteromonas salexigens TaxID=2982530 RepID=A0ABT2VRQ7_9ALTE|nr:alanine racemase [Alteromonas salexigens]MCU7556000.1 alanine racemase [Alteromonas salexigens]
MPENTMMTPACLIDEAKFKRNVERVANHVAAQGCQLRPHVKTLKSVAAARYYAPPGTPITVSTLAEASYFLAAGYRDILYAVVVTPNKLSEVASLVADGAQLTVMVDSVAGASALSEAWQSPHTLQVAIEVDVDGHRAGIQPDAEALPDIATLLCKAEKLQFHGLVAHAGASYGSFTPAARHDMAEQEVARMQHAVRHLTEHGFTCQMVSIGSTPTALEDVDRTGITEIRAGVYATFDCVMAGLDVCKVDDIALSVLTSVIGTQPHKGQVLIDAGWMALSRDTGTATTSFDCGYGLVCDLEGKLLDGWYVAHTNQEHGIICHRDGGKVATDMFRFGQMLRILPVHACATASQFSQYTVVDAHMQTQAVWSRVNGW